MTVHPFRDRAPAAAGPPSQTFEPDDLRDFPPSAWDDQPVLPPPRPGFSIKAAMIVPGLGLVILVVFVGIGLATSKPVQPTKTSTAPHAVRGTTIAAVAAVDDLRPILVDGQPPSNIVNSVSVPKGSQVVSHENNTASAGQYDAQIELRVAQTQGALLTFFRNSMKQQGWQIFDVGPARNDPNAVEVLGKEAGSDGFYWEMGAVVSATQFGHGAPATGATPFTVRLFQVPDPT